MFSRNPPATFADVARAAMRYRNQSSGIEADNTRIERISSNGLSSSPRMIEASIKQYSYP